MFIFVIALQASYNFNITFVLDMTIALKKFTFQVGRVKDTVTIFRKTKTLSSF